MLLSLKNSMPISVWYMLLSALGFALMAACVKSVSTYGIPVLEIVAARAIVSAFISYVDIKRKKISLWGNNKPLLIARGTVGAVALIFVYYAVTTLPLAEATVLQYLHPVFTAVLAVIFLKEKVQRSTLLCIVVSLLGLGVMVSPNIQFSGSELSNMPYSWLSIGAAVLGAFGSAVAYVLVKKLTKTEDSSVIIFYFPFVSLPIAIVLLGSDFVMPSLPALGLLLLVGIFTQVGQVGLTKALHSADANKATAYAYVQVVFSVLIGWFWFSEVPLITTLIGGALVISGALINVMWKK
ncbi:DMT family transporter [Pseudocolwellia sp. AS88]|jgi:drug/metabolite transporter (DMT)-like permease|uniref:DMT family transporter n=1 Tax=Pseudocolwellia sp. AS88 TaxID=3063958 RepID=UPI0026EE1B42|nr:DMT family transporter [Pseudocolwellia sp. AS88]MDO7086419.1 DMT family transporter [Pseudocolwellia sp. AS88]